VGPLKPGWALRPGVPARSMVVAVLLAIPYDEKHELSIEMNLLAVA